MSQLRPTFMLSGQETDAAIADLAATPTAGRLDRLTESLISSDLVGLWVTKPVNVRYLCGFTGSNSQLLVRASVATPISAILFTDGRYRQQACAELAASGVADRVDVVIQSGVVELGLAKVGWPLSAIAQRLGFEGDHLSVDRHQLLLDAMPELDIRATSNLVADLRAIKDSGERLRLVLASSIADRALAETVPLVRVGTTELEFAAELEFSMRRLGSERASFATIVASGPNSANPHHQPTKREFADGDLVVIDFGATIDGYGSDMTRTLVVGDTPDQRVVDLYNAVEQAQAAGVSLVRPGVQLAEIDARCREVLSGLGYGDNFIHGTGHSLGLEIHEEPMLSSRSVGSLRAGLIVTIEPGAYVPGFGGVRIEDTVVVTDTGCESITHAPKGLIL